MIPPTSIDGTDITGATIDGTDVTEITVDGDVVFSAAPAVTLPTPIHDYPFDEGSSSTVNDIIGGNDLTGSGGNWISDSDARGGEKLELDGVNIEATEISQMYANTDFSVALTINPAFTSSSNYILHNQVFDGNHFVCTIENGVFIAGFRTTAGSGRSFQADQTITTGRNRVVVTFDSSTDTTTVYVAKNGSNTRDSSAEIRDDGQGTTNAFRINSDNVPREGDAIYDNIQVYDEVLTQAQVNLDYDNLPSTP